MNLLVKIFMESNNQEKYLKKIRQTKYKQKKNCHRLIALYESAMKKN